MGKILRQEQQNEEVPCQELDRRCRKQPRSMQDDVRCRTQMIFRVQSEKKSALS